MLSIGIGKRHGYEAQMYDTVRAVGLLALGLAPILATAGSTSAPGPRAAAVARPFYPADKAQLERAVRAYMEGALPPRPERPIALVLPHAGYRYSAQIAADGYRQAVGHDYDLVVILGTNHTSSGFDGVSVYQGTGYRTPLGVAPIDREVAAALAAADERFAFRPDVHAREHSIEVQVPFVQTLFPDLEIVAAVVGRPDPALAVRFARSLKEVLGDRRPLIIASSDLSHYPAYDDAVSSDRATLTALVKLGSGGLLAAVDRELARGRPGLVTCACGKAPMLVAIEAAKLWGAGHGAVISYANSGDTSIGDRSRVVGYGAVVLAAGKSGNDTSALERVTPPSADAPLRSEEKRALLSFARTTIESWLEDGTAPLARGFAPALWREQGAFVTLKKRGELRGCIGHREADRPLCQVVGSMALQAAFNDRRFRPVRREELGDIEIEISLLTPLEKVRSVEEVKIGRDGVMLRKDGRGAIYLPEVAVEQGWNHVEMMDHLCRKAGLPAGAWREGAELFTFRSVLIRESDDL